MNKSQKHTLVDQLAQEIGKAQAVLLTDFLGLTVDAATQLRKELRQAGCEYKVVKNTLSHIIFERTGKQFLQPFLKGTTGIVYAYSDEMVPLRILHQFKKKNKEENDAELPTIKAAVIHGTLYAPEALEKIADLPPREVLIAKALGSIKSPLVGLVSVLGGVLRQFVNVLDAASKKQAENKT